jgi:hypothetical protein
MRAASAVVWLVAAASLAGCATVTVQKERFEKVKTVAIIGFTGEVALKDPKDKGSSGGIAGAINGVKNAVEVSSGEYKQKREQQAEQVYGHLTEQLSKQLGWSIADKAQVANNPEYAKLMLDNPSGGLGTGYGQQIVPGLLREEAVRTLDDAARAKLLESLKVDALAVMRVKYVIGDKSGVSIGGVGKTTIYPKAIVQFTLYDGASKDPAWKDKWAEGQPTSDGQANTMGVQSDDNESQVLVAAADSAVGVLLARVSEKR